MTSSSSSIFNFDPTINKDSLHLYKRKDESVTVYAVPTDEPEIQKVLKGNHSEKFVVIKRQKNDLASYKREVAAMKRLSSSSDLSWKRKTPQLLHHEERGSWSEKNESIIVMSYLRAMPLHKLFFSQDYISDGKMRRGLPRVFVVALFGQMYLLLRKLHRETGIVHRDLKLPNILFERRTCSVCFVDFGHAYYPYSCSQELKAEDEGERKEFDKKNDQQQQQQQQQPMGTLHIRAPEMYNSIKSPPQPSFDVFALGCDVVELLTGNPCFGSFDFSVEGKSADEIEKCIQELVVDKIIQNSAGFCEAERERKMHSNNSSSKLSKKKSELLMKRLEQKHEEDVLAADFCKKLLEVDVEKRMKFFDDESDVLRHPFIVKTLGNFFCEGREDFGEDESVEKKMNPTTTVGDDDEKKTSKKLTDLEQWTALMSYLIQCFEDLEDEIHMQMLGM